MQELIDVGSVIQRATADVAQKSNYPLETRASGSYPRTFDLVQMLVEPRGIEPLTS
jgi:hypothetical protein